MTPDPTPTTRVRPGPLQLDPGQCPDGLVVHVYAVPSARRLLVRHIDPATFTDADALADADEATRLLDPGEHGVCLVMFDGDTGDRIVWP